MPIQHYDLTTKFLRSSFNLIKMQRKYIQSISGGNMMLKSRDLVKSVEQETIDIATVKSSQTIDPYMKNLFNLTSRKVQTSEELKQERLSL